MRWMRTSREWVLIHKEREGRRGEGERCCTFINLRRGTQAHGRRRKDAGPCLDASRKRKSNRRAEGPDLHKKEEEGWFKKKQRLKRQR